jgi:flagellar L-ring protein precursor FlgH
MLISAQNLIKTKDTLRFIAIVSMCLLFTACAVTPDTIIKKPTTATPTQATPTMAKKGAIFNVASYRPLFEDRRARMIGDILTITITENTSVTKSGSTSGSKKANVNATVTKPTGFPVPLMKEDIKIAATSDIKDDEKTDGANSNVFTGSITVTVTNVLENGNLEVSGEKQISLDKGNEYVRFSGVVNPDTITTGNMVVSTKVADARIEYRTNSKIDGAQIASILARFFLSFSPL